MHAHANSGSIIALSHVLNVESYNNYSVTAYMHALILFCNYVHIHTVYSTDQSPSHKVDARYITSGDPTGQQPYEEIAFHY